MQKYIQPGFFDLSDRYDQLSQSGDPLIKLNELIDWRLFAALLDKAFFRERKSEAGRKPYNRLLMFKILVLQSLYNLSDHQVEFQIRDRLSFMRFLNLTIHDKIPDEKTLWSYREVLVKGRVIEKLFVKFNRHLEKQGYGARAGSLVDATLVEVPRQRNSREENQEIKEGKTPESFKGNENRLRQKDVSARWSIKGGKTYYGYKNHVNADVKHKLIQDYAVTSAAVGDIHCLESLLFADSKNESKIWADGAYYSGEMEQRLKEKGYESRIIRRYGIHHPLQQRENSRRAKVRKRVEHVFGFMENSLGGKFIKTIGLGRATMKIGMMNLVYNFCRYEQLCRIGVS